MRKLLPAGLAPGPLLLAGLLTLLPPARAELTDEQKRKLFLQTREDIRPVPRASSTPRPRPTPAATRPAATPRPTPRATPTPAAEKPTPPATPRPQSTPEEIPAPPRSRPAEPAGTPEPRATPPPKSTPTPRPTPAPTPTPPPQKAPAPKATPTAPIVIEKSGRAEDEGEIPPPKKRGWSLFGGGGPKYVYLTAATRAAIDKARVKRGRWKYIVVHNSGTRQGNAKAFDNYHRKVRKMENGMAYHFVIGNGRSSGNGEIEIGNRWTRQINGGHVASDYLNNIALGICFVGDFNRDVPTKAQLAALQELITYLRTRCGKVKGKNIIVRGHRQINPKPTDCPGNRYPLRWLNGTFKD